MNLPEVLKNISDLPKPIIDSGVALIRDLLGGPVQQTGELIAEQIYAWRWANRIRIFQKASERLSHMNIPPTVLPPGFLTPLLETCGDVEDESLQNMWASLLAEGVRSEKFRQSAFRKTLESLSSQDAQWLMILRRDELANPDQKIMTGMIPQRATSSDPKGGSDETNARLLALGLQFPVVGSELASVMQTPDYRGTRIAIYNFELSNYGRQFLAVVGGGEFPWPAAN